VKAEDRDCRVTEMIPKFKSRENNVAIARASLLFQSAIVILYSGAGGRVAIQNIHHKRLAGTSLGIANHYA